MLEDLGDDELHDLVWLALVDVDAADAIDSLPEPLVTYWHTQLVDYEVGNGGFLQLFHNATRMIAERAVDGFVGLGLDGHAGVLRRAIDVAHRPDVQADIERIWSASDNLAEFGRVAALSHFDELDEAWDDLPPAGDAGLAHLRRARAVVEEALALG